MSTGLALCRLHRNPEKLTTPTEGNSKSTAQWYGKPHQTVLWVLSLSSKRKVESNWFGNIRSILWRWIHFVKNVIITDRQKIQWSKFSDTILNCSREIYSRECELRIVTWYLLGIVIGCFEKLVRWRLSRINLAIGNLGNMAAESGSPLKVRIIVLFNPSDYFQRNEGQLNV